MTSALVVYESLFGDNRTIARAVADGLSTRLPARAVAVAEAPAAIGDEVGLLVVGGPNHAAGMPRPATRAGAVRDHGADVASPGTGLREWLERLDVAVPGLPAAAWDTRMDHPRIVAVLDHAARTEEKLLRKHSCAIVAPAEHFSVTGAEGPLADGEEERARRWGAALAEAVTTRVPARS